MHNPTCGTLVPAVRHRLRGRRRRSWCSNIFVATQYLFIANTAWQSRGCQRRWWSSTSTWSITVWSRFRL